MAPRVEGMKYLASDAGQAMLSLANAVDASGLERSILDIVKVRASHISPQRYMLKRD